MPYDTKADNPTPPMVDPKHHKVTVESVPESPSEGTQNPPLGNVLLNIDQSKLSSASVSIP
ncbi:hypothetical protein DSO57_1035141 [Entomophthora muscae]|uniref:Uncharacterized protein n=1 Tax=Entomophthora muscae TaxID=34485 RepID=A0ACC2RQN1_9FUNG|nr:hypothetical protein DSO57_1035141 [Entomophthora muscae]